MTLPPTAPLQRRAPIGRKPATDPASAWVRRADASDVPAKASVYTARLTIDVTPNSVEDRDIEHREPAKAARIEKATPRGMRADVRRQLDAATAP